VRFGARGLRFGLAGGVVAIFYTTSTTFLSRVAGLPFQLALAIAFASSLALHFTLQRLLVWRNQGGFALSLRQQLRRYLGVALAQYLVTALVTRYVPSAIGVSVTPVYYVTFVAVSATNFVALGGAIFHSTNADEDGDDTAASRH
jgi:putative flippase GtrA